MLATLLQEALPVDAIESVLEVDFKKHLLSVPTIACDPLSSASDANLGAKRLGHSDLERKEERGGSTLDVLAQALGHQASERFSHSDRSDVSIFLK